MKSSEAIRIAQAVADLSRAAKSFSELAEDVRREPKKYINLKIF